MKKTNNSRVLIVEDDEEVLALIKEALNHEGYCLETALDASEAMEKVELFMPQLALVDLKLPGEDGISLAERLKKHDPKLQILVISGYGTPERVEAALTAGVDRFIMKPFKMKDLITAVSQRLPLEN